MAEGMLRDIVVLQEIGRGGSHRSACALLCFCWLSLLGVLVVGGREMAEYDIELVGRPTELESKVGDVRAVDLTSTEAGGVCVAWILSGGDGGDRKEVRYSRTDDLHSVGSVQAETLAQGEWTYDVSVCVDGRGSAFVAWKRVRGGLVVCQPGDSPPRTIPGTEDSRTFKLLPAPRGAYLLWLTERTLNDTYIVSGGERMVPAWQLRVSSLNCLGLVAEDQQAKTLAELPLSETFVDIAPLRADEGTLSVLASRTLRGSMVSLSEVQEHIVQLADMDNQVVEMVPYVVGDWPGPFWGATWAGKGAVCVFSVFDHNKGQDEIFVGVKEEGQWSDPLSLAIRESPKEAARTWFAGLTDVDRRHMLIVGWVNEGGTGFEVRVLDLRSGETGECTIDVGERVWRGRFCAAGGENGLVHLAYMNANDGLKYAPLKITMNR